MRCQSRSSGLVSMLLPHRNVLARSVAVIVLHLALAWYLGARGAQPGESR